MAQSNVLERNGGGAAEKGAEEGPDAQDGGVSRPETRRSRFPDSAELYAEVSLEQESATRADTLDAKNSRASPEPAPAVQTSPLSVMEE